MDVQTARFGKLRVAPDDVLTFEQGMIGLRDLRRWIVLADLHNPNLGWLQSIDSADTALGVVNPRRFVPDYRVRISRRDIDGLQVDHTRDVQVAVIVNRCGESIALNLRAPLVINLDRRCGCQVVVRDEYPVRRLLRPAERPLQKSA